MHTEVTLKMSKVSNLGYFWLRCQLLDEITEPQTHVDCILKDSIEIISICNGNGLELGPDGRRLPKTIAVFDVLSKL